MILVTEAALSRLRLLPWDTATSAVIDDVIYLKKEDEPHEIIPSGASLSSHVREISMNMKL